MYRTYFLSLSLTLLSSTAFASQIDSISLAEVESRADFVVLARVTKVEANGNTDQVSIRVSSYLKGKAEAKDYVFNLVTRGGLKDFDPLVKEGDVGVFFLRSLDDKGNVGKAYWGSIAIFPKNHFDVPDAPPKPQPDNEEGVK